VHYMLICSPLRLGNKSHLDQNKGRNIGLWPEYCQEEDHKLVDTFRQDKRRNCLRIQGKCCCLGNLHNLQDNLKINK